MFPSTLRILLILAAFSNVANLLNVTNVNHVTNVAYVLNGPNVSNVPNVYTPFTLSAYTFPSVIVVTPARGVPTHGSGG